MVVGLRAEERSRTDPGFVGHEAKNWPPVVFRSAAHKRWVSRGSSGTGGLARGAGERAQEPGGLLSPLTHRSQAHSQGGTTWRT